MDQIGAQIDSIHRTAPTRITESNAARSSQAMVRQIAVQRRRFVYPLFWTSFAIFGLSLVALAYLPSVMSFKVWGSINLAYLLALAQFVVTFAAAAAYSLWARSVIDPIAAEARLVLAAEVAEGAK